MKAFLSHKSEDKAFVEKVIAQFPAWLRHWLDRNQLLVGDDLRKEIQNAIRAECHFLIVFISDDAIGSAWVKEEVDYGKKRQEELSRVFVLPVLLNCTTERLNAFGLEGKIAIRANGRELDDAKVLATQLVEQISAHCAKIAEVYTTSEKPKRYLLAAYIALLVASAAGGSKVMSLGLGPLAAGVTVLSFAFTFLITDCVNQLYGQEEAKKFIVPGFLSLLLATGFMYLFVFVPPHEIYTLQTEYALILTPPFRMFIAGMVAYVIGQICNLWIFDQFRRFRGWNNVGATLASQFVDTIVFIFVAFWGLHSLTFLDLVPIMGGQFAVKALIALVVSWPAFMYLTSVFRRAEFRPQIG